MEHRRFSGWAGARGARTVAGARQRRDQLWGVHLRARADRHSHVIPDAVRRGTGGKLVLGGIALTPCPVELCSELLSLERLSKCNLRGALFATTGSHSVRCAPHPLNSHAECGRSQADGRRGLTERSVTVVRFRAGGSGR
jgi:hypothetical protein